ncbi:MAG: hypothetical protein INH41_27830, partial [Myxococcaceae bacterium]|nr:hypothetical protein [Myxococcaceae bacterium]
MRAPLWLSLLKRQKLMLGAFFVRRWPHDWLVRLTPQGQPASTVQARDLEVTQVRSRGTSEGVLGSDCQCWSLEWAGEPLSVGRAGVNDFVINDVTVPRVGGLLLQRDGRWWWRKLGSETDEALDANVGLRLGDIDLRVVPSPLMDEVLSTGTV